MGSCEGIVAAKERFSQREAAISGRLISDYRYDQLPAGFYYFLFDLESERNFIHIVRRERDRSGEIKYTSQSPPYGVGPESTILDAVCRMTDIFRGKDIILVCDEISEAKLVEGCKPLDLGRGRFRISRPNIGIVDYYLESAIINRLSDEPQPHSQSLVNVLR